MDWQASLFAERFGWSGSFLDINGDLLAKYRSAADAEEVLRIQDSYLDSISRDRRPVDAKTGRTSRGLRGRTPGVPVYLFPDRCMGGCGEPVLWQRAQDQGRGPGIAPVRPSFPESGIHLRPKLPSTWSYTSIPPAAPAGYEVARYRYGLRRFGVRGC